MQTNLQLQRANHWLHGNGGGGREELQWGINKLLDDGNIYYLLIMVMSSWMYMSAFIKLCTLNMCTLLYVRYTLISCKIPSGIDRGKRGWGLTNCQYQKLKRKYHDRFDRHKIK